MKQNIYFKRKNIGYLILLLSTFLLFTCQVVQTPVTPPTPDNPVDPENPEYEPPNTVIISGLFSGDTLNVDSVQFIWRGNLPNSQFSYRLNQSEWSEWSPDTVVSLRYLDEGEYLFEVKCRWENGDEEDTPDSSRFIIDAVRGPALMLVSKNIETNLGQTFELTVYAEEVQNLYMSSVVISFDPWYLHAVSLSEDTLFLAKNGGNVQCLSRIDNSTGKITAYLAAVGADSSGVDGTGALAKILFSTMERGFSIVSFTENSAFKDVNGNPININQKESSYITIQ